MSTSIKNILAFTAIITLIAVSALYIAYNVRFGEAANPGNLPSFVGTSSIIGLLAPGDGATAHVLFEPTNNCSSRVVSTGFHNILLAFEGDKDTTNNSISSTTLSLAVGHWQAASTTVTYPAENYGCGWITGVIGETNGVGDLASTSISVFESY